MVLGWEMGVEGLGTNFLVLVLSPKSAKIPKSLNDGGGGGGAVGGWEPTLNF